MAFNLDPKPNPSSLKSQFSAEQVKKIGGRGKLIRYGKNLGNRPLTTSEMWFPLCARKLAEAFAEALRLRKLFFQFPNPEQTLMEMKV